MNRNSIQSNQTKRCRSSMQPAAHTDYAGYWRLLFKEGYWKKLLERFTTKLTVEKLQLITMKYSISEKLFDRIIRYKFNWRIQIFWWNKGRLTNSAQKTFWEQYFADEQHHSKKLSVWSIMPTTTNWSKSLHT